MRIPASSAKNAATALSVAAMALTWIASGCRDSSTRDEPSSPLPECPIRLRDVGGKTGIAFVHTDGSSGQRYIPETVTAGLALVDYNGDGKGLDNDGDLLYELQDPDCSSVPNEDLHWGTLKAIYRAARSGS